MGLTKSNHPTIKKTTSTKKKVSKRKHGAHIKSATTIDCLPNEMIAEVLARLAASSPVDLFRCKQSCKVFHEISEEKQVLQKVSLETLVYQRDWWTEEASKAFVTRCLESDNPEALLHRGMSQYFGGTTMVEEGLKNLEKAATQTSMEAAYVLSLIFLSSEEKECVDKGVGMMVNTMKAIGVKGIVECRKKVRDMINSMWLTNKAIVQSKPNISCSMREQHEVSSGWDNGYYEEDEKDNLGCQTCKCVRELDFFSSFFANF